jgi:hypothetical protein
LNALALLIIHLRAKNLPKPEFEYKFHPTRKWKFDAAYPDLKIAIEAEGGFFGVGKPCRSCGRRKVAGHTSIARLFSDAEKYNAAAELGWRVLRYPPKMIESGEAIRQLERVLGK